MMSNAKDDRLRMQIVKNGCSTNRITHLPFIYLSSRTWRATRCQLVDFSRKPRQWRMNFLTTTSTISSFGMCSRTMSHHAMSIANVYGISTIAIDTNNTSPNLSLSNCIQTSFSRVLHWFKNEYFTWVNEPPCASCGVKSTWNQVTTTYMSKIIIFGVIV